MAYPVHRSLRPGLQDPQLLAEGIGLRMWEATDRDALVAAWADPEICRWTSVPDDAGPDSAARWIAGERRRREEGLALDFVGVSVEDGRVLGEVGLSAFDVGRGVARIGWWTAASERGRGVATAMVRALTDWAHDGPLALRSVLAEIDIANPASAAVAQAAGYELLSEVPGRPTDDPGTDGGIVDRLVFASRRPAFAATGESETATRV